MFALRNREEKGSSNYGKVIEARQDFLDAQTENQMLETKNASL